MLKKHERLCGKHDYSHVKMPKEDNKILKYNCREKSLINYDFINYEII